MEACLSQPGADPLPFDASVSALIAGWGAS
jgi:hypothetical protein